MMRKRNKIIVSILLFAHSFAAMADELPPEAGTLTGDWGGARTKMREKGFTIKSSLILDDTWTLHGGKHRTRAVGDYEYLFDLSLKVESRPLFHYSGGTLFIDFQSHHGKDPSKDAGTFVFVDVIEARPFNELYALWYKQASRDNKFWILAGKSDAYDNFLDAAHDLLFMNSGYQTIPTVLFLPTYPDPAMSVIGSATFPYGISLTTGVFDGSLADGVETGKLGVFGHFFHNLPEHAFLIGELDVVWNPSDYKGRLGIGGWKHTAEFTKFDGGKKKGAAGPYATLDQIIYKTKEQEGAVFFLFGSANPSISAAHYYFGTGLTWQGATSGRPQDTIGIGMSRVNFSHAPGTDFTESNETSYEAFYVWQFAAWGFLEPDFQYIVHPGGQGLPNASVFTLRLEFNL